MRDFAPTRKPAPATKPFCRRESSDCLSGVGSYRAVAGILRGAGARPDPADPCLRAGHGPDAAGAEHAPQSGMEPPESLGGSLDLALMTEEELADELKRIRAWLPLAYLTNETYDHLIRERVRIEAALGYPAFPGEEQAVPDGEPAAQATAEPSAAATEVPAAETVAAEASETADGPVTLEEVRRNRTAITITSTKSTSTVPSSIIRRFGH